MLTPVRYHDTRTGQDICPDCAVLRCPATEAAVEYGILTPSFAFEFIRNATDYCEECGTVIPLNATA